MIESFQKTNIIKIIIELILFYYLIDNMSCFEFIIKKYKKNIFGKRPKNKNNNYYKKL